MNAAARILLAEDEAVMATLISDLLADNGFDVTTCGDGAEAWSRLEGSNAIYDLIILDRVMPGLNGMEVLRRVKAHTRYAHVPVVMETAQCDTESIREGLAQGAYYYLTKPFRPETLLAVVQAALAPVRALTDDACPPDTVAPALACLREASFHYSTLDEAHALAEFLGKACPDPQRATQGLLELFVNAVEHGNLGITYAEKGELVMRGEWQQEVDRRLRQAEYVGRRVEVDCERHATHLRITIRDQGPGFDWSGYLDFDPERAFHLHGRGIAMARRMCFEHLEYQGSGNVVVVEVASPAGSMQPA